MPRTMKNYLSQTKCRVIRELKAKYGNNDTFDPTAILKAIREANTAVDLAEAVCELAPIETYKCDVCSNTVTSEQMLQGVCSDCEAIGWWYDPAGGLHHPGETDPAKMYE